MFSADVFGLVEKFLSAAIGFFYSTLSSTFLLWRFPRYAPRLLNARLKRTNLIQVGPLTLLFLSFCLAFSPLIASADDLGHLINALTDENRKASVAGFISLTLVSTLIIDGFSRIFVLIRTNISRCGRLSFTDRVRTSNFQLVMPIISLCLLINILLSVDSNWVGLAILILAPICMRLSPSGFYSFSRKQARNSATLKMITIREVAMPLIITTLVAASLAVQYLVTKEYPTTDFSRQVVDATAIRYLFPVCEEVEKSHYHTSVVFFNLGSSPAVLRSTGNVRLYDLNGSVLGIVNSTKIYAIINVNGLQAADVSFDTGDIATEQIASCNIDWLSSGDDGRLAGNLLTVRSNTILSPNP